MAWGGSPSKRGSPEGRHRVQFVKPRHRAGQKWPQPKAYVLRYWKSGMTERGRSNPGTRVLIVVVRTLGHLAPGTLQAIFTDTFPAILPINCTVRIMSYLFGRYQKKTDWWRVQRWVIASKKCLISGSCLWGLMTVGPNVKYNIFS